MIDWCYLLFWAEHVTRFTVLFSPPPRLNADLKSFRCRKRPINTLTWSLITRCAVIAQLYSSLARSLVETLSDIGALHGRPKETRMQFQRLERGTWEVGWRRESGKIRCGLKRFMLGIAPWLSEAPHFKGLCTLRFTKKGLTWRNTSSSIRRTFPLT